MGLLSGVTHLHLLNARGELVEESAAVLCGRGYTSLHVVESLVKFVSANATFAVVRCVAVVVLLLLMLLARSSTTGAGSDARLVREVGVLSLLRLRLLMG